MSHHRSIACAALLAGLAFGAPAQADQFEIATLPQGSVAYGAGVAIAGIVSSKTPHQMLPVPHAGPQVVVPAVNEGRATFTLINVGDSDQAYKGLKPQYDRPNPNLRLASVGYENRTSILVTVKSNIRTAADLKGKSASGELSAHQTCKDLGTASMATLNITWDDFKVVPVPSVVPAVQALGQRVEVSPCAALGMAQVKELNIRTPIRFISIDPSPEAIARARQHFPGVRPVKMPAGSADGIIEDTWVLTYDFYLVTNAKAPDEYVYTTVKAVWDNLPDLEATNPLFKLWAQNRMANADVTLPYHPAAIKFYREKGVWTPEMEATSKKILAEAKSG
jgi:TRAP transporter TAXI family solute receptor